MNHDFFNRTLYKGTVVHRILPCLCLRTCPLVRALLPHFLSPPSLPSSLPSSPLPHPCWPEEGGLPERGSEPTVASQDAAGKAAVSHRKAEE